MSGAGNDHPAHAWARHRSTLDWLQLLLDDPLATDVNASGILPPGGLCDVHVVELVALASDLTAHFNVEHAHARHALQRAASRAARIAAGKWAACSRSTWPGASL
jgi:hypothetical protein